MKKTWLFIPILLLAALALTACGQSAEKLNNDGNEAFANQDYQGALMAYHQAQEEAPELAEPHYNEANTHYRLEDYEQAQQQIEQALVSGEDQEALDQSSYYNLGNVFFQAEQYEAAIESYKEALRLDPTDLQAKQNLELALKQLQQQQQEQQQQQDQQNQDQQQDQQSQDQQQDQQNQDQQQGDQQQDDGQQDGQQDPQQQDQQPGSQAGGQLQGILGLTEEQARQLLEAAAEGTESLEEFLQQILVFPDAPPAEDW
jgi:Ca-activated chloride channel family protein